MKIFSREKFPAIRYNQESYTFGIIIIMKLLCVLCDWTEKTPGREWIKQVLLASASLFPASVSSTAFLMNLIAIYYHASRAIPFLTMVRLHDSSSSVLRIKLVVRYILWPQCKGAMILQTFCPKIMQFIDL